MGTEASKIIHSATDIQTTVQTITQAALQPKKTPPPIPPAPPGFRWGPNWSLVPIAHSPLTPHHFMVQPSNQVVSKRIAPTTTPGDATFTDKLTESLLDTTVLASSAAGGASGLLLGGDNKVIAGLIGFSCPILFHALLSK